MTSPINARHPTRIHRDVWIDHDLTHHTLAE
jgi:hypothetical protein